MLLDDLLAGPQFATPQAVKERTLVDGLAELQRHHRAYCEPYRRLMDALHVDEEAMYERVADLPFLPVRLFKEHELRSIAEEEVFKVLTSSGTTGQAVSRIYLDRDATQTQARALSRVMAEVLGPKRLPMLIVDHPSVLRDRRSFSARGAGVAGMMNFGRRHAYALDERFQLDEPVVRAFLDEFGGEPFLVFGFTYMVWLHLYEPASAAGLDLSNGVLVHSGGWKKLLDRSVSLEEFRLRFAEDTGLTHIYNFYGMVEQIGSVFLEAPDDPGVLYAPSFADVVIRDPETWEEVATGGTGIVEVVSMLPRSYPGHALLTEDLGELVGVDDGPSWSGKRFRILGRVPRAEVRGCSDTFEPAA